MKRYIYRLVECKEENKGFNSMLITNWCETREAADKKAEKQARLFGGKLIFIKEI